MKNQNNLFRGEGNTPIIRLTNIEKLYRWEGQLWAKAEYQNPTGSFKDRGSVTETREAIRLQKNGVVCASTGNMAASLAAYARQVNLPCYVVVPKATPRTKLHQAVMCGARLIEIDGTYDDCVVQAKIIAQTENALLCGDYQTRRIGQRSIGFELAQSDIPFDAFICPVGNGTVGCAIAEGFSQYNQSPAFLGVQGTGADPIFQAWKNNTSLVPIKQPSTIASAMKVGSPLDGNLTLDWVKKTNGKLFSITDKEILQAQQTLAQREGIFVEKASASTCAVLPYLDKTMSIVLILTGSGMKEGDMI